MTELTTEQRLQVFMLYPNAEILYNHLGLEVRARSIMEVLLKSGAISGDYLGKSHLLLKPLEAITEEHLKDIAEFVYSEADKEEIELAGDYVAYCFNDQSLSQYDVAKIYLFRDEIVCMQTIDYLRSKNYSLPYMGIDLFESGLATKD